MPALVDFLRTASIARDVVVAMLGLCVGSFLNVLALRSLQEKSIFWPPSYCPKCEHRLGVQDLLPVVSWLMLRGKCRYCQARISWQYPVVEAITAVSFVIIVRYFGFNFEGAGMLVFACTLIAVSVTDFREKLIPHEITYPSMLIGIIYSGICAGVYSDDRLMIKHDLMGTLAGIGISYILFDFLAFYGLKLYTRVHGDPYKTAEEERAKQDLEDVDDEIDTTFDISRPPAQMDDDFEVMGGGDAVLAAVIAAWLGLSRLSTALVFGFLAGMLMGAFYLIYELIRQKMLSKCIRPALIGIASLLALMEAMLYAYARVIQAPFSAMPWWQFGIIAVLAGALAGVVVVGSRVSKPFPFGPALAAGAVIAMFYDPFTNPPGGA